MPHTVRKEHLCHLRRVGLAGIVGRLVLIGENIVHIGQDPGHVRQPQHLAVGQLGVGIDGHSQLLGPLYHGQKTLRLHKGRPEQGSKGQRPGLLQQFQVFLGTEAVVVGGIGDGIAVSLLIHKHHRHRRGTGVGHQQAGIHPLLLQGAAEKLPSAVPAHTAQQTHTQSQPSCHHRLVDALAPHGQHGGLGRKARFGDALVLEPFDDTVYNGRPHTEEVIFLFLHVIHHAAFLLSPP